MNFVLGTQMNIRIYDERRDTTIKMKFVKL